MFEIFRGQFVKLLSVGAKAAILFVVVPHMHKGEYAIYFFWTTVALILARLLGSAAEEQIVLFAKGVPRREYFFFGSVVLYLLISIAALVLLAISETADPKALVLVLCLSLVCNNHLSGIIRARFAAAYELAGGLPWMIAVLLGVLTHLVTAGELMLTVCTAYLASNLIMIGIVRKKLRFAGMPVNGRGAVYLWKMNRRWRVKLLSNMLVAINLRNIPIVKGLLSQGDDSLALAFSVGEVCYQLAMVKVNRTYASQAVKRTVKYDRVIIASELRFAVTTAAQCAVGFYLISLTNAFSVFLRGEIDLFLVAIAYCGMVSLFCFYRMHVWIDSMFSSGIEAVYFQVALIVAISSAAFLIANVYALIGAACLFIVVGYFYFTHRLLARQRGSLMDVGDVRPIGR